MSGNCNSITHLPSIRTRHICFWPTAVAPRWQSRSAGEVRRRTGGPPPPEAVRRESTARSAHPYPQLHRFHATFGKSRARRGLNRARERRCSERRESGHDGGPFSDHSGTVSAYHGNLCALNKLGYNGIII